MAEQERLFTEPQAHQHFAVALNNLVWSLLDKKDRTSEDNDMMVHAAHASMYHWSVVGKPEHRARGEWLISRVYAVQQCAEPATHHALASLDVCTDHGLAGFDIAYAHEACARAFAAAGDAERVAQHRALAREFGNKIDGSEDRALFFSDFDAGPWYGIDAG